MRQILSVAALAAFASILAPAVAHATPGKHQIEHRWFADYDAAVVAAKAEGKDLLVDFTGSDWCGWCIKLHEEVFRHDTFYNGVSDKYVLVALDFPNGAEAKAKVPNAKRNQELQQKYEVQGFPTVLLMSVEGEVFGSTGYRPDGPEKYVEYLGDLTKSGKALVAAGKSLAAEYTAATDKAAVVKKAVELLGSAVEGAAGAEGVAVIVRHAYTLDPQNESGLKLKAVEGIMKAGVAEAADLDLVDALDAKNETGLLERALVARLDMVQDDESATDFVDRVLAFAKLGKVHDKEALQNAVHAATYIAHANLDRPDDSKTLLAYARTLGEVPQGLIDALKG